MLTTTIVNCTSPVEYREEYNLQLRTTLLGHVRLATCEGFPRVHLTPTTLGQHHENGDRTDCVKRSFLPLSYTTEPRHLAPQSVCEPLELRQYATDRDAGDARFVLYEQKFFQLFEACRTLKCWNVFERN